MLGIGFMASGVGKRVSDLGSIEKILEISIR